MDFSINNGVLTIKLNGRIDNSNAQAINEDVQTIVKENEHTAICLDADALEYISSAGLRVVLNLKRDEEDVEIINTSTNIYEIFEITGFTEIINVSKAYRKLYVDGCKVIGKGAKGTVYRYADDTIVKVYESFVDLSKIKKERELAKSAFVLGVPTAIPYDIVKVGDQFGAVFELLDAKSYSQLIVEDPSNFDKYVEEFVKLLKIIHSTNIIKDDIPSIEDWVGQWKERALPYFSEEQQKKIEGLFDGVKETHTMVHGDFHTNNVMSFNNETLLIDMDTLAYGNPIYDIANLFMTMVGFGEKDKALIENFLKVPLETANKFWNKFIVLYMGTDDPEEIKKVEDKAKLICYLHLVSHFVHHGYNGVEEDTNEIIQYYKTKTEEMLEKVDTLNI